MWYKGFGLAKEMARSVSYKRRHQWTFSPAPLHISYSWRLGLMDGLFSTDGALAAFFIAWTTFVLSRLRTIQITCVVCILGATDDRSGKHNMFQASRFIMGWGIVPLYLSELATPTHRRSPKFEVTRDPKMAASNSILITGGTFFKCRNFRKRFAIGMSAQLINLGTGNLVVNNYQVPLCQRLGVKGGILILLITFCNCVGMLGNMMSAFFIIDKYGRRPFYMLGIAECGISLVLEAALTKYYVETGAVIRWDWDFGFFSFALCYL
ncbi:hypothetical protein K469DRAFT_691654 [Zopfia rhizophila CBS 207.26]|uniref:Major facilitator superfamily (MFS) profile domain-containing protein n=1 Tax=Zopfia rhizophila CBS 207.26 TaxID=1314779 RepID=A0A6A6DT97_9PEZI|nr:hypothetical protein K469DRAFT_691654 [Zopfia rhizophila CBS 207.26]